MEVSSGVWDKWKTSGYCHKDRLPLYSVNEPQLTIGALFSYLHRLMDDKAKGQAACPITSECCHEDR